MRRTDLDTTYVNNSSLFIIYSWRDFKISITGDLESDGIGVSYQMPITHAPMRNHYKIAGSW